MSSSDNADIASGWLGFGADCGLLMAEAAIVAPLRIMRIASGGAPARAEAWRMVAEKVEAQLALAEALATGSFGVRPDRIARGAVRHYLGYVRANRRRLLGARGASARD